MQIAIPDGTVMTSATEGHMDIPGLPPQATITHIVPEMTTHNLLSMGQLCDAGCTATVDRHNIEITHNDQVVITGTRSADTSLWHMDGPDTNDLPKTTHMANAGVGQNTTQDMVKFMHAAFFSPALSTLEKAFHLGYIPEIPGFTASTLKKYPPFSTATVKGHMDQTRKNVRSTKSKENETIEPDDFFPLQLTTTDADTHANYCYMTLFSQNGRMYSDQTGNFFQPSSRGNLLIMILYDYDSNAILAEPIKNRKAETILAAYRKMYTTLRNKGMKPKTQVLDNECSNLLKDYMTKNKIQYQLAPPGQHRTNAAERAIRTFKNHFIAGLCSTNERFPLHLWDRLIEQAVITLNLMRGSRINPAHSAWSQLFGPYNFNKSPLAPPGIQVLVHEKPDTRKSWAPHASEGWYIGPALEHYRCYKVYMCESQKERITDTVTWVPQNIPVPTVSTAELIVTGLQDVATALKSPSHNTAIMELSERKRDKLIAISNAFRNIISDDEDEDDTDIDSTITAAPPDTSSPRVADTNEASSPRVADINDASSPRVADTNESSSPRVIDTNETASPRVIESVDSIETGQDTSTTSNHSTKHVTFQPNLPIYRTYETISNNTNTGRRVFDAPKEKYPIQFNKFSHKRVTRSSSNAAYVSRHAPQFALFGNAINPDTNLPAEYLELSKCSEGQEWIKSASEEFGRLAQGNGTTVTEGTDTIRFISVHDIPQGKKPTYMRMVVADRPEKPNPKRVRNTIGGDRVQYDGDTSTKAAELTTCKLFLNSVISTPNARCVTGDLKDFYLQTAKMPEKDFAYMFIPVEVIPPDIFEKYKLKELVTNNKVYVEVSKGIYGLPQAGKLANDQLIRHLAPYGYAPVPHTAGLWKHETKDITFLLVVDDFAIKYTNRTDAEHLLDALRTGYKMSVDWDAERYCGLILKWDYNKRTVDLSMPGYIERALQRFRHTPPKKPQHNPYRYIQPEYGTTIQYEQEEDTSEQLDAAGKKRIQEILGTLLYYARAVDPTLLVTVSALARQQKAPTTNTMDAVNHLLDYCATHPDAVIRFHSSDMILHVESDASYLSEPNAKSRAAGFHYLSQNPHGENIPFPEINGAVLVTSKVIKETVSSAAEAELAALFHNGQDAYSLRVALEEMNHPQPPTPIQTDNSTAAGLANDSIKQKRSKAMSMRWFWIRDKVHDNIFNVYWNSGKTNRADYFSKQHPTKHHIEMRPLYLHVPQQANTGLSHYVTSELTQVGDAFLCATGLPDPAQSDQCSKGVLISESGLHPHTSSDDLHATTIHVSAHDEMDSDHSRCPITQAQPMNDTIMSIVDHNHS
jgi:hypothetical protein